MAGDLEGFGAPIVGNRHIVDDRLEHLSQSFFNADHQKKCEHDTNKSRDSTTFPRSKIASKQCTLYMFDSGYFSFFPFNFETNKCKYDYLMTDKTWILKSSNFERKNFWWGKSLLTKGATSEMARTVTSLVLLRKRDQNDICRILF